MDPFPLRGILRRPIRLPYLPLYVDVLNTAVGLDVLSGPTQHKSVRELSEEKEWNEDNTRYFPNALYCPGFVWKRDRMYYNCRETDRYLAESGPKYISGHPASSYTEECMGYRGIKGLVEDGPSGDHGPGGQLTSGQHVQNMQESQIGFHQTEI